MTGAATYKGKRHLDKIELENDLMEKIIDRLGDMPHKDFIKVASDILNIDPDDLEEALRRAPK